MSFPPSGDIPDPGNEPASPASPALQADSFPSETSGQHLRLGYADDITLMAESKEELKSLLMKVKEKNEKADLKLNIKKQRSWHPVPSLDGK